MIAVVLAAAVLTGALVTGCTATAQPGPLPAATAPAGAPASTRAPSHITTRQVPQARSDPGAGAGYASLALVGPAGGGNGKLVVFLPGTGDAPSCCQQFLAEVVVLGFHASASATTKRRRSPLAVPATCPVTGLCTRTCSPALMPAASAASRCAAELSTGRSRCCRTCGVATPPRARASSWPEIAPIWLDRAGRALPGRRRGRAHRHEAPGRRRPFLQRHRTMTTSARRLPGVAERCLNQGGLGVSVPGAAQRTDPSQPSLPASGHQHARARRDLHRMAGTFNRLIPGTRIRECHNRINPR